MIVGRGSRFEFERLLRDPALHAPWWQNLQMRMRSRTAFTFFGHPFNLGKNYNTIKKKIESALKMGAPLLPLAQMTLYKHTTRSGSLRRLVSTAGAFASGNWSVDRPYPRANRDSSHALSTSSSLFSPAHHRSCMIHWIEAPSHPTPQQCYG